MYHQLDRITLKSGEVVQAGVVQGPDLDWAERVETLLSHKGSSWRWGNEQVLRTETGLDVFFYLLHRDGDPFANIMTIEYRGVGLLGHVYTRPEDRRQGAAMQLMACLMGHFRQRGGQALFLGTGYDTPPYHIYRVNGFAGVELESGYMDYYSTSQDEFEGAYFAPGSTAIEPVGWLHWPVSIPLFLGAFPGVVRGAGLGVCGRRSTEGPLLPLCRTAWNATQVAFHLVRWLWCNRKPAPWWVGRCGPIIRCGRTPVWLTCIAIRPFGTRGSPCFRL